MPLYGELQTAGLDAPVVEAFATDDDAWTAHDADVFTFTSEIDARRGFLTVPPALHPSLPPYLQIVLRRVPDGPFGPMATAEVNVRGRSTIHQVGYTIAAYATSADAAAWLRTRFGQPAQVADIDVERRYYGVEAAISVEGKAVFAARMENLHYISPTDVLFTPTMNLAIVPDQRRRLVQMELEYVLERAERGVARVETFDATAIGEPNLVLTNPLPPTLVRAKEMTYQSVRFLVDPDRPAMEGTEKIEA